MNLFSDQFLFSYFSNYLITTNLNYFSQFALIAKLLKYHLVFASKRKYAGLFFIKQNKKQTKVSPTPA